MALPCRQTSTSWGGRGWQQPQGLVGTPIQYLRTLCRGQGGLLGGRGLGEGGTRMSWRNEKGDLQYLGPKWPVSVFVRAGGGGSLRGAHAGPGCWDKVHGHRAPSVPDPGLSYMGGPCFTLCLCPTPRVPLCPLELPSCSPSSPRFCTPVSLTGVRGLKAPAQNVGLGTLGFEGPFRLSPPFLYPGPP